MAWKVGQFVAQQIETEKSAAANHSASFLPAAVWHINQLKAYQSKQFPNKEKRENNTKGKSSKLNLVQVSPNWAQSTVEEPNLALDNSGPDKLGEGSHTYRG